MARFARSDSTPTADLEPGAEDYEVMQLRHLPEHPRLAPLYQRKAEVQGALQSKARERQRLAEALTALEHREVEEIAALGAGWDPAEHRKIKKTIPTKNIQCFKMMNLPAIQSAA